MPSKEKKLSGLGKRLLDESFARDLQAGSSRDKPYPPPKSSLAEVFVRYLLANRPSPDRITSPHGEPSPKSVKPIPKSINPPPKEGATVKAKYVNREETYLSITPTEVKQLGQFNISTIILSTLSLNFLISFTEALRAVRFDDQITYQDVDLVGSFLLFVVPGIAAYFFHKSQSTLSKKILEQVPDDSKNS